MAGGFLVFAIASCATHLYEQLNQNKDDNQAQHRGYQPTEDDQLCAQLVTPTRRPRQALAARVDRSREGLPRPSSEVAPVPPRRRALSAGPPSRAPGQSTG